ncbi:MAG TPA: HsdR family type I site-specific deoxyribonuclease [bacterium]|nr:HsdR family type I site-specific deoxyribonuclease [bacterium]HOL35941.1 HsdR family type I site-specific deoxyribonuclease [bacterium]HPP08753.1 HsdR family type I site-specific deoxyribonuclease [bacterium]
MGQYEKKLVEDYVSERLQQVGWTLVNHEDLKRESLREPLLIENLKEAIIRVNKDKGAGEEEIKKVIDEIKLLPAHQEGIKKFLHYLKYGIGVKFEKERIVKIINLIDYENPENNEFIFSRQVHFKGNDTIIPDIVLYINGIPVVEIECKSPVSLRTDWFAGYQQIKKYEEIVPELYKYMQIGISFCENVRYFPIVPWNKQVSAYTWKKNQLPEDEAIFELLTPFVLIDVLKNFIFMREQYNEMKKVVARYMQYRAVNKIYTRVIDNLKGRDNKNKGLIWHWQGSGKTLTIIFAVHKLYGEKFLENPTLFIIVDRRDLEQQMKEELSCLQLNFPFEVIENVNKLKEIISYDNFKGKRGVFLTLMHKFSPDERFLPDEYPETISERKNVVCFLDEVHRTQYGLLAASMRNVLKNAFYFGFTGTPIAENERNTYSQFGYPLQEEGYLDKYFLDQSLQDGFTVPLIYSAGLEELHVSEDEIKTFVEKWEQEELQGDIARFPRISEKVQRKLNNINLVLENRNRIEKICMDIAGHFKENVDGKFKAMVVCGSRTACVIYKEFLDKYLPRYSEVVMSFLNDDKEPLKSFYAQWTQRHSDFSDNESRINDIIEKFKKEQYPKILIVTDMLITGFDAPVLQVMYLDKLLKKHRLLQAIARINRPYDDVKAAGIIIDYAGILSHLNYALRDYYKDDIRGLVLPFDRMFDDFEKYISKMKEIFDISVFEISRDKLLQAVEILKEDEIREKFFTCYKKARKIFEVLASSPEKMKYLNEFEWFTAVYDYYRKLTDDQEEKRIVEKFFRKTVELVHKKMEVVEVKKVSPDFRIDLKNIEKYAKNDILKKEKVINIIFILSKLILVEKSKDPVYRSIADRVKDLVRKWKERQIDIDVLFSEEKKIAKDIEEMEKEKNRLVFDNFQYGIYLILKNEIKRPEDINEYVREITNSIKEYMIDGWIENSALRQNIERKTREICLKMKNNYGIEYERFDLLHKKIVEFIKDYGS